MQEVEDEASMVGVVGDVEVDVEVELPGMAWGVCPYHRH